MIKGSTKIAKCKKIILLIVILQAITGIVIIGFFSSKITAASKEEYDGTLGIADGSFQDAITMVEGTYTGDLTRNEEDWYKFNVYTATQLFIVLRTQANFYAEIELIDPFQISKEVNNTESTTIMLNYHAFSLGSWRIKITAEEGYGTYTISLSFTEFVIPDAPHYKLPNYLIAIVVILTCVIVGIGSYFAIRHYRNKSRKKSSSEIKVEKKEEKIEIKKSKLLLEAEKFTPTPIPQKAQKEKLKPEKHSGSLVGHMCMICKTFFKEKEEVVYCPTCKSLFHKEHLIAALIESEECPICDHELELVID